tara:strand:+ start:673 stop:1350 length:678 start_codon:yes stop_codon:yes gene_type:complete
MSFKNIIITKSNNSSSSSNTQHFRNSKNDFDSFLKKRRFESFVKKKPNKAPLKHSNLQKHFLKLVQNRNKQKTSDSLKNTNHKKVTKDVKRIDNNIKDDNIEIKSIDKNIEKGEYSEKSIKYKGGNKNVSSDKKKSYSKTNSLKKKYISKKKKMSRRRSVSFTVLSKKNQQHSKIKENKIINNIQNMDINQLKKSLIKHKLIKPMSKAPDNVLKEIALNLFSNND